MNKSHGTYSYVALKAIDWSHVVIYIAVEQNILHAAVPKTLFSALVVSAWYLDIAYVCILHVEVFLNELL